MTERDFPKNPRLETKRLVLRKPKKEDWKDLVEGLNEIEVTKNTSQIPHPYKKKDAIKFIKEARKKFRKRQGYPFFLELKDKSKVIGCIDISNINKFNGTATTGSWVNKNYWKRGFITEAKIAANSFVFNKLGLRRLDSEVYANNEASNKTQKRLGYKYEGTRREAVKSKASGKIHDSNVYGLLKEDWRKESPDIKKHLQNKIKKLNKSTKK